MTADVVGGGSLGDAGEQGAGAADARRWSATLRRRGAVVLGLFAVLWGFVAASGLAEMAWPARWASLAVTAAVLALALRPGMAADERPRAQPAGWHRRVGLVNGGQFAVIALVVVGALALDAPQVVAPAVALVVGAHFVPLAREFDQPEYRWTAAGLCAGGLAGLALLAVGAPFATVRVVVGAVAVLTLEGTALRLALATSLSAVRRGGPAAS